MSNFLSQLMLRSREADNSHEREQEKVTVITVLQEELSENVSRSTAVVKSRFKPLQLQMVNLWPERAVFLKTSGKTRKQCCQG